MSSDALVLRYAAEIHFKELKTFFEKELENISNIYSEEFLCPFGLKAALKRKQVIVAFSDERIVAALRFYARKKDAVTSLYQFAIDKDFRGNNLLKKMLPHTHAETVETKCLNDSSLNLYFKKTGWSLEEADDYCARWRLSF